MYVWDGSSWVQVGDASTPQTTIDIAQSAPQGAITGSIWYDDDAGGLFVYDGAYWVNISGPQGPQGATGATGPQGAPGSISGYREQLICEKNGSISFGACTNNGNTFTILVKN